MLHLYLLCLLLFKNMPVRANLYSKPVIGSIQQGSIFNHALSIDYKANDVYGIIITPRCDIENAKVSTLHYLPIVKFSDWIIVDLFPIVVDIQIKSLSNILANAFNKFNISLNLIGNVSEADLKRILKSLAILEKDQTAILKAFIEYSKAIENRHLEDPTLRRKVLKALEKNCKNVIAEILSFKRRNYYFLEHWCFPNEHLVVLLREIRSISSTYAQQLSKGCKIADIKEHRYNEITYDKEAFSFVQAEMNSPYIEHLIQSFFHNIGRIGIEDYRDIFANNLSNAINTL